MHQEGPQHQTPTHNLPPNPPYKIIILVTNRILDDGIKDNPLDGNRLGLSYWMALKCTDSRTATNFEQMHTPVVTVKKGNMHPLI